MSQVSFPIPDSLKPDPVAVTAWEKLTSKFKFSCKPDKVDLDAMERYCHYASLYENARKDIEANGTTLKASNGIAYRNPSLTIMHQAQSHLLKLGKAFGYMLDA